MAKPTIGAGVALIVLGIISYAASGAASATALIPTFFGLPLAIAGAVALSEARRKTAMHVAAAISLLGTLAPLGRLLPALGSFELTLASASLILMLLICGVHLGMCVRSFVAARRGMAAV